MHEVYELKFARSNMQMNCFSELNQSIVKYIQNPSFLIEENQFYIFLKIFSIKDSFKKRKRKKKIKIRINTVYMFAHK